jgi:hypothetical protein
MADDFHNNKFEHLLNQSSNNSVNKIRNADLSFMRKKAGSGEEWGMK